MNYKWYDTLSNENALFLVLCRLRHVVGLADLAIRLCLSTQSTSVVFNTILDIMDFKFGQLSLWPYRDLVIIDGTELNAQVSNALGPQSQLFSEYKASTTF